MRQTFDSLLRVRIPNSLAARLESTADASARTYSDLVREALVIGLERFNNRLADDSAKAA